MSDAETQRILNQVMLRGCQFRVNSERDSVAVPIPIPLRTVFAERDVVLSQELAVERMTISKNCAQAYLDLHRQMTGMANEIETINKLTFSLRTANIRTMSDILHAIDGITHNLNRKIQGFLEDEEVAKRRDYPI